MRLYEFQSKVDGDGELKNYMEFIDFTRRYLDFVDAGRDIHPNIQADIVSTKENQYHFLQYKDDGGHCLTRPINMDIFLPADEFDEAAKTFVEIIKDPQSIANEPKLRNNINRVIYTCQQSVGCTLDAFNNPNKARKRNGALFEILIRSVVSASGVSCLSYEEKVNIYKKKGADPMKFQHDIVLKREDETVAGIGQLKTSSKDRIDKIFLDKYMYNKLQKVDIPHFAIFLNDVQRSHKKDGSYAINSTFLPGHFKAYTMALTPLDGVYYFDPRPIMIEDAGLASYISRFDKFLVEDMWQLLGTQKK